MHELIKLISSTGLTINETKENIVIADYKMGQTIIAKYIISEVNSKFIAGISEDDEKFIKYENEYIAPIFYSIDDDLSWNLYVIFVLPEEEYNLLSCGDKYNIENNERYARKIIVSKNKFADTIPVGKVSQSYVNKEIESPVDEWMDKLYKNNLSFCLKSINSNKIQDYLDNNIIEEDYPTNLNNRKINSKSLIIKTLNIDNNIFRKQCFKNTKYLKFGNINILYGPNGSGKTSVLEAIELIFTGEIKKSSLDKDLRNDIDLNNNSNVVMNNEDIIKIPLNNEEKKYRESYFYKNNGIYGSRLNSAFHLYNYYSVNDTYEFCYLRQHNYKYEFSKMIFGDNVIELQKNIKDYIEKFTEIYDESKNRYIKYLSVQNKLENRMKKYSNITYHLDSIYKLLEKIEYKDVKFKDFDTDEELKEFLFSTKKNLGELKLQLIVIFVGTEVNSLSEFEELYNNKINELSKIDKKCGENKNNIISYEFDMRNNTENINLLNKEKQKLEDRYKSLIDKKKKMNEYSEIYNDVNRCNTLLACYNAKNTLKVEMDKLKYIKDTWRNLLEDKILSFDRESIENEKNNLVEKLYFIKDQLNKIEIKIRTREETKFAVNDLVNEIKTLGIKYVNISEDNHCPLCGKEHEHYSTLINKIKSKFAFDDFEYSKLIENKKHYENKIKVFEVKLNFLKAHNLKLIEINKAYNYATKNNLIKNDIKPELKLEDKYFILENLINNMDNKRNKFEEILITIKGIEVTGLKINKIVKALEFINDFNKSQDFYLNKNIIMQMREEIDENISIFALKINDNIKSIKDNEELLIKKKENLLVLRKNLSQNQTIIKELELETNKLNRINNLIDELDNNIIEDLYHQPYKNKLIHIDKVVQEMDNIIEIISNDSLYKENHHEINKLKALVLENKEKEKKSAQALEILTSLKTLNEYAEKFIVDNISEISNIFISLHSPREFDRLDIDDDGEIICYRDRNELEKIPLHELSNGQRTVVVLSIFIRLHMIMKSSPNFILLDEPVANIDDMNVLALFDFLKEVNKINNTQIFLSTANDRLSRLIKRKFSYLDDKLMMYNFEKYNREGTKIQRELL